MVVKVNESENGTASADPLRGVASGSVTKSTTTSSSRSHKEGSESLEFQRLKKLVPTIARKDAVSKLDVILEAIRYIDQLQDQLVTRIQENKISVSASVLLAGGKENIALSAVRSASVSEERSSSSCSESDSTSSSPEVRRFNPTSRRGSQ